MKLQKTIFALPVQDIKVSCNDYTTKLGFLIRQQEETFAIPIRDAEIHLWQYVIILELTVVQKVL